MGNKMCNGYGERSYYEVGVLLWGGLPEAI